MGRRVSGVVGEEAGWRRRGGRGGVGVGRMGRSGEKEDLEGGVYEEGEWHNHELSELSLETSIPREILKWNKE